MKRKNTITKAEHKKIDQAKVGNILNELMIKLENKKMNNKNSSMIVVNSLIGIETIKKDWLTKAEHNKKDSTKYGK